MKHIMLLNFFGFMPYGETNPNCAANRVTFKCDYDQCVVDTCFVIAHDHLPCFNEDECFNTDEGGGCMRTDSCTPVDNDYCNSDVGCYDDICTLNNDYCHLNDASGCKHLDLHPV